MKIIKDIGKYHYENSAIRNESNSNDYDSKLQQATTAKATTQTTLVAIQSTGV